DACPATCRAIVAATRDVGFDADDTPADRAAAYAAEAARLAPACDEAARALYALAVDAAPDNADYWLAAAALERKSGQPMGERSAAAAASVLERAVACQPQCEALWLALADCSKSDNKSSDDAAAWGRGVLERAFAANPASESIVLAAVALEADAGQHARAVALLERATSIKSGDGGGGSPRVWLKAAVLQRRLGNLQAALEAARRGRELFPNADGVTYKLWLIESQVHQQMGDAKAARQTLALALAQSPRLSAELWISAAALDAAQEQGSVTRARAVLERARVYIPRNPRLWLAAIRLEADRPGGGGMSAAQALLSRALQECPRAGCLWAESVLLAERPRRKAASVDALKNSGGGEGAAQQDPEVCTVVARLFAAERKPDKARAWFARATSSGGGDWGDAWAWWLRFESSSITHDNDDESKERIIEKLENACAAANPRHGQVWPTIAKDPANYGLSTIQILRLVAAALAHTRQIS
ncbi:U4/U6 x U5 tri-snRNP complex subunit Prp1, partial [Coemansia sp. RSA 2681]